ncbi:MAG TPA: cation-transporting P-type ATPase [Nitriliruptorales bacterium]|nr:cation-transporting P-type ATPase [Nitriliruptorales bacterium]
MPLGKVLSAGYLVRRLPRRGRRIWFREGHAHVEYRDADPQVLLAHLTRLIERLGDHQDVHDVEVDPASGRLIVTYDDVWLSPDDLVELLDALEEELGVADDGFGASRPDHPGDAEPILREAVLMAGDVAAVALAAAGRVLRRTPLPRSLDLGWAVSMMRNFPQLRHAVDERVGHEAADLLLGLSNSLFHGLSRNVTSPVVDLVHRALRADEALSRRVAWQRTEPQLCAARSTEEPALPVPRERVVALPPGDVERWADQALPASIGGLASGLAATNDLQRSVTSVLDTLPKAARLGREAFAARLDRVLACRDIVTMDSGALRLLDRVDAFLFERSVVVDGDRPVPGAPAVLIAARRSGMFTVVDGRGVPGLRADQELDPDVDVASAVEALQLEGHVVAMVSDRPRPATAADLTIGVAHKGEPAPWGAHVITGPDPADLLLLVEAAASARRVSQQSVRLAQTGTGIGAGAALGGLHRTARERVIRVTDAASLIAMVNGVRVARALHALPATLGSEDNRWHARPADEVLQLLGTSREGLRVEEAQRRRQRPSGPPGALRLLLDSLGDELVNPLTPILAGGAGLSLATGALADAAMVASVVGLNAVIGGFQRFRTERAIAALDRTRRQPVLVRRAGTKVTLAADELVPGDVVLMEAGEAVPADCRVLEANGLEVDESSLTGESLPVRKSSEPSDAEVVAERRSMVYEGTSIAAGTATAVVVAVGEDTEAGRAFLPQRPDDVPTTGVEARLRTLTRTTIPLALGSGLGVAAAGFLRRVPTQELIDASVGLAVAAVPEGLPLLATVAQLAAARRLSHKAVLVRNPRAVEALGRVDVVCADKTGTLTEGRIRLTAVSDGVSQVPIGEATGGHHRALLTARRATPIRPGGPLPHPTDQAIADGTRAAGVQRRDGGRFDVIDDVPFEPARSFHAVLAGTEDRRVLAVKGATEVVLERCTSWAHPDGERTLDAGERRALQEAHEAMAAQGLRVLAVAERPLSQDEVRERSVRDLTFVGFVGLSDPVRPVAADAVADLRAAGVGVIMITGDHPATARGIAAEVGLDDGSVLTGPEVDDMEDDELERVLPKVTVFARVTPGHKVRIVRALQRAGRVVAMTGDGANDAPAIRLADVGIALGKRATPAARDAADIIITEERLEVIVDAIAEGRGLWESVRDAVAVLVGGNIGEIAFTLLGSLVGRRPPLNARQLLLVNLFTDVVPAMAIAVRPPTDVSPETLLHEGPEASLGEELNQAIRWRAWGTAVGATGAYAAARLSGTPTRARTVGLIALVGAQLGQTIAVGANDPRVVLAGLGSGAALAAVVQTPGASRLVGCRPVGPVGWWFALAGALAGSVVGTIGPRVEGALRAAQDRSVPAPTRPPETA